ncbi:hypothetical protein GB937_010899, partial [Aspergillus fischeri]
RLVCFAYRSTRPDQPIQLRHQLNTTQLAALDQMEDTLVAFLAVLGVDPARQTFREPYSYTSYLSGLVKMAQMLVALQAVHLTRAGA